MIPYYLEILEETTLFKTYCVTLFFSAAGIQFQEPTSGAAVTMPTVLRNALLLLVTVLLSVVTY